MQVKPPTVEVTRNDDTGSLLLIGGVQRTVSFWSPRSALTPVGASGNGSGVTDAEATDATDVPTALVAVTVNVYAIVLFSGPTTHVVGFGVTPTMVVQPADGGVEVTV